MGTTYYHSTRKPLETLRSAPLCVTDDCDSSLEYLDGAEGHLYEVVLTSGLHIARESHVADIASELHPHSPYTRTWERLEMLRGVRDALIEAGYDGVRYEDETPDNRGTHDTIVLFDAAECVVELIELEIS